MRLDKFLKVMCLIKRRTVAGEAASEGFVKINGKIAKPSATVKEGSVIEIDMWNYYKKIEVLTVPTAKNVPKKSIDDYIKTLEYKPKSEDKMF